MNFKIIFICRKGLTDLFLSEREDGFGIVFNSLKDFTIK